MEFYIENMALRAAFLDYLAVSQSILSSDLELGSEKSQSRLQILIKHVFIFISINKLQEKLLRSLIIVERYEVIPAESTNFFHDK